MENEVNNISKKKSFFKELIKQFSGEAILFGIILYFAIAGLIGYFVTDYQNVSLRIIKGMGAGFLIIWVGIAITTFGFLIIELITFDISKIKAIKRYTYLPLTVEEIKQGIKNGLFSTKESYIKYICDQLRYESLWGLCTCNSVKLTNADLILLCRSVEEVYENLIVFRHKDYKYFKKFNMACPFEFKTVEGYIKSYDVLLDIVEDNGLIIFCSDKNKAEAYLSSYKGQAVIYDVRNKDITRID